MNDFTTLPLTTPHVAPTFELDVLTAGSELEKLINRLVRAATCSRPQFKRLKDLCFELISRFPMPVYSLKNTFLVRSRENFDGELFNSPSHLSYNTNTSKIKAGRFNRAKESVFYGALPVHSVEANGHLTTICESCKELFCRDSLDVYKTFTTGKWNIVKPLRVVILTFFDEFKSISLHARNINAGFVEFLTRHCNQPDLEKCNRFLSFFSSLAAKKNESPWEYQVTTAFFHALKEFYGSDVCVMYSSSMTDNKGLNIAVPPAVIDTGMLELEGAVMFRSQRDSRNFFQHRIAPISNYASVKRNGTIEFSYIK